MNWNFKIYAPRAANIKILARAEFAIVKFREQISAIVKFREVKIYRLSAALLIARRNLTAKFNLVAMA